MRYGPVNITTNDTTPLITINAPRLSQGAGLSVFIQGTFGSATVTLQVSPDGGTTKYTAKDINGNDCITTSQAYFNIPLAIGGTNDDAPKLYALTAGGSGTNINIYTFDLR